MPTTPEMRSRAFAPRRHDHRRCIERALNQASRLCRERGVRLTEIRRQVLALVWAEHRPVGAYDILAMLSRDDRPATPPTVYRALEFLVTQGFVHRIESRNAFVGCSDPAADHGGHFLLCRDCGRAAELDGGALETAIRQRAVAVGFAPEGATVEIYGLCPDCRGDRRLRHEP